MTTERQRRGIDALSAAVLARMTLRDAAVGFAQTVRLAATCYEVEVIADTLGMTTEEIQHVLAGVHSGT